VSAREGGATLLIALVLMALVTVAAAATLRFSASGLRIAVNEELRSDALQNAQSLVDAVLSAPANTNLTLIVGAANCVAGISDCNGDGAQDALDQNALVLDSAHTTRIFEREDSSGSIRVRRLSPDVSTPPRGVGYSAVRFQASFLQVESRYDGTAGGWGQAALTEGVAVIVPHYGR
jgi:Tfp pilus assembly protein PilX